MVVESGLYHFCCWVFRGNKDQKPSWYNIGKTAIIVYFTKNKSPISHFEKQGFKWSVHNHSLWDMSE